jgi:hypothetical protein
MLKSRELDGGKWNWRTKKTTVKVNMLMMQEGAVTAH